MSRILTDTEYMWMHKALDKALREGGYMNKNDFSVRGDKHESR